MSKINEFVSVNNLKRFLQNADERFAPNKNMEGIKSDGADGYVAGKAGLVPAPSSSSNGKFLRSDGTWATPEVPTKVSELDNDSNFLTSSDLSAHTSNKNIHVTTTEKTTWNNKANKATTLSGYGITDAYTKTQVDKKVSDLVNSAPETLDTLNELASALGNDPNFATTVANQIGTKANDSNVVHKSGDETVNGTKTFSGTRTKFYKSLDLYHNEDYKLNTNPSVKAYQYVFFTGKSGWYSAFLENQVDTDGASYCNLLTRNTNEQSAAVQLAIDSKNVKTLKPATSNDISLGTSANKWKDVYAKTFNGNLVGNADTATNNASGNELSNNIIKGLSVNGKVITYTKLDGSTGTITTQDTNTDTKVTNTLGNTTKAYITGTTSATTNTGTQIFDSGVYLTTTAGQLHADIDFPITEAQVNKILGIS